MKIAVIGAGVSGLASAYLLSPHAEVTVYEKEDRLGGHANTADITVGDKNIAVDTGFMVFNPHRYPYFVQLLKDLDVSYTETDMSFSVSIPDMVSYSSYPRGLFGNMRQLCNPRYVRFLFEIMSFNRRVKQFLRHTEQEDMSLGDFYQKYHFSRQLVEWYLYPMLGCIWSSGLGEVDNFPARETFRFLDNHCLLNLVNRPRWRTVEGGSRRYVEALVDTLEQEGVVFRRDAPVTSVIQNDEGSTVVCGDEKNHYDYVVFATHADDALYLLDSPTEQVASVLGLFSYTDNETVLHRDARYMPPTQRVWASWNYFTAHHEATTKNISLTYWMNNLQGLETSEPVLVTLNPTVPIDSDKIYQTYQYRHPHFNQNAHQAQQRLPEIQGKDGLLFTGAHWGFGFHEDGIVSAVNAVKALGLSSRLEHAE